MKLPFSFKTIEGRKNINPWQWPSCKQPKTLSFRASNDVIKTMNSVFFDLSDEVETTPDTWFTTSSEEAPSLSTHSEPCNEEEESSEVIVHELMQAERLFCDFEETRSILKNEKGQKSNLLPFEDSVALAMESKDPCGDFRKSMEEMVETHGLRGWECLEELLGWYLKVNGKKNHGFIVGAFVDLLVGKMVSSNNNNSNTTTNVVCSDDSDSFASCVSSPCTIAEKEISEEDDIVIC